MADTGADEVRFVAEVTYGATEFLTEVVRIRTTHVGEFGVLEEVPNALVQGAQVRCIPRQGLQVQALGRPTGEEVLDRLATMNGRPIPQDEQCARDLSQQVLEEPDHIRTRDGVVLQVQVQLSRGRDSADGRQRIARQAHPQHGRLTPWRVGAHTRRQQRKAGFISPDQGTPFVGRFVLSSGQRSSCHWAMAASSRWVARCSGFWGLQSSARKSRLTWSGWYRTPNCASITAATRGQVHRSPRKPNASAPCASSAGTWSRCSGGSFGGPRRGPPPECLDPTPLAGAGEPLAHRPLCHPQGGGDGRLRPALLSQLPGPEAPPLFPVVRCGKRLCCHTPLPARSRPLLPLCVGISKRSPNANTRAYLGSTPKRNAS
jgi:hypothetical protein